MSSRAQRSDLAFFRAAGQRGMGTPADNAKALYWFTLAQLQGNAQALYNLQMCGKYLNEAQRSEYNRRVIEWQATRK